MKTYISMLRGLNVGKHKRIKMEELKDLYESLNLKTITIYLQSGNVIFQNQSINPSELAKRIEDSIKEAFGFDMFVLIKTPNELKQIIDNNPFKKEESNKVYITFLFDEPPSETIANKIDKIKDPSERYYISAKEIYLYCPNGYGISKLSNNFFEKKLQVHATTRNLNTVSKLYEISKNI